MDATATGLAGLLMLADARLPAGGHAHSGGVEAAVAAGWVRTVADLAVFLRGRLRTAGAVAAGLAAAACAAPADCDRLDAEADARIPSPALRTTSRQQGRALLRTARAAWPAEQLDRLAATPGGPHHAVALGAVAAAAGAGPVGAAQVAGYLGVSGPAAAAVRLCGFDPIAVNGVVAALAGEIAMVAARAVVTADLGAARGTDQRAAVCADPVTGPAQDTGTGHATHLSTDLGGDPGSDPGTDPAGDPGGDPGTDHGADPGTELNAALAGGLPAASAPRLDLLAELHARAEVRLFAS